MGRNNGDFQEHGSVGEYYYDHHTSYESDDEYGDYPTGITVTAYHRATGNQVGRLDLEDAANENGEPVGYRLYQISVNPEHRRRGVATGMVNHAKSLGLVVAPSDWMTKEGYGFSKSIFGKATPKPSDGVTWDSSHHWGTEY